MSTRQWGVSALLCLCLGGPTLAEREITAEAYLDRARGAWMGQILGNYAGRGPLDPTDPASPNREGYIQAGGGTFDIGWESFLDTPTWIADDDTALEYLYLQLLRQHAQPSYATISQAWQENLNDGLYIANLQARRLMDLGIGPPQTGSIHNNMHWYAIDSQIATEALGATCPGLPARATELAGAFAGVTNDGYSVHAAQFYAALHAEAAFETDMDTLVSDALAAVPQGSRTREVIQAVRDRYTADEAAGNLTDPDAWRTTQLMLHETYGKASTNTRYRNWVESTVNCGLTTMALLYGQGDFVRTVEIGVQAGYDADCNPATAGGVIGMSKGYAGVLADLAAFSPNPSEAYDANMLDVLGGLTNLDAVAADLQQAAELQIQAAGGIITRDGGTVYSIPDAPPPSPDPVGGQPGVRGLVQAVRDTGGTVTPNASIARFQTGRDRRDLAGICDGVTDLRYNGFVPYWTADGDNAQPPGGDFYELDFDRVVAVESVVFHEGDVLWNGPNSDPRVVTPKGGYFLDLTVEVLWEGEYHEVDGLALSEPLDPFAYYQVIELTFETALAEAVRIRGTAGGTQEFTTIVELEAFGRIPVAGDVNGNGEIDGADIDALRVAVTESSQNAYYDLDGDEVVGPADVDALVQDVLATEYGDCTLDGVVDAADLSVLAGSWMVDWFDGPHWAGGDVSGDGQTDAADLSLLAANWQWQRPAGPSVPEPASWGLALLAAAGLAAGGRRSPRERGAR